MVIATTSNVLRRITTLLIISCLLTVGLCVNTAAALPGSGTQEDPWRIQSLADFDEFAADPNSWSGFSRLETDVNLAGRTYTTAVIAPDVNNANYWYFDGTPFTGVFDGNDHKITGLTIDDSRAGNWYLGLFGCIDKGEVRNLDLEGGSVNGDKAVGGLVGSNGDSYHPGGSISNCYSTGDVNGYGDVGGLVGWNVGSISNCYSNGDVSGGYGVGGLVGYNSGSISNCHSTGSVSGDGVIGGLVGGNIGSVSICYSTGDVSGYGNVGGLAGGNSWGAGISNCYSTGDVNGVASVGGLVGGNGSIVCRDERCFISPGDIYNSYSIGCVQGNSSVGGLVGHNECGEIQRSFWDVETTGEPNPTSRIRL